MNPVQNVTMALFNHLGKTFEQDFDLYVDWSEIDESRRIGWRRTAHVAIGGYERAVSGILYKGADRRLLLVREQDYQAHLRAKRAERAR
jgi:hypothetical protein